MANIPTHSAIGATSGAEPSTAERRPPGAAATPSAQRFVALLDQHKRILYKVANAYCREREERGDLIQDIVLALWQSFGRFDDRVQFSTWMQRIAMNVAISFWRGERRRIRNALPLADFAMDLTAADELLDRAGEEMQALQQLLRRLDDISRALVLLYLEGYSHAEIGAALDMTSSNVATRINRLKLQLQAQAAASETGT